MRPHAFNGRGVATATFIIWVGVLSPPFGAAPRLEPTRAPPARALRSNGGWQRDGRAAQHWDIELTRRDATSVEGRVTFAGSPVLRSGVLRGSIDGRRVSGSVSADDGTQAATFVGVVLPSGVWRGTYQDRTGEIGHWTWDGPDSAR
ncbi:MAG: hypothetical protein ABI629_02765 [bacterium]